MKQPLPRAMIIAAAIGLGPPAIAQTQTVAIATQESSSEEPIRARGSNRHLDPDVVRCQRRREPGSFRERRICLTNRQWDQIYREGNRDAQTIQDMGRRYASPDG